MNEKQDIVELVKKAVAEGKVINIKTLQQERQLPFVWELDYNGTTSYAVGTKHNEPRAYTADISKLMRRVKRVCFEIKPEPHNHEPTKTVQFETAEKFAHYLKNCPTPELAAEVGRFVGRLFGYLNPEQTTSGKLPGVDGNILDVAQEYSRPIFGLETHEERYPYLTRIHENLQTTLVLAEHLPALIPRLLKEMNKTLDQQDKTYRMGEQHAPPSPQLTNDDKLLIERNILMAYRGLEHLVEEPTLIAAGYDHFVGPEPTMLTLYQEKGIKIKRIE